MATSGVSGNPNDAEVETAVPTLKVMRLQKPELHMVSTTYRSIRLIGNDEFLVLLASYIPSNTYLVMVCVNFYLAGCWISRQPLPTRISHVSTRFIWRYVFCSVIILLL